MFTKWFPRITAKQAAATDEKESGQSIVIIAFVMIGLLAFAGIAVDVGFVFARAAQLQAGVDAAVLAGVTELTGGDMDDADERAAQFLRANNIPISVTETFDSSQNTTALQAVEYSLTATWPVELFFLRVIGFDTVNVTRSATAAYFPLADIYANRQVEYGFINTANQSVFGPNICTSFGDPFSPWNSEFYDGPYTWQYRIYIPPDYSHDVVRVEIFDPDSINQAENTHRVYFSDVARQIDPDNFPIEGKDMTCSTSGGQWAPSHQYQPCVLETGELDLLNENLYPDLDPRPTLEQINPYWFVRIDENRGAGAGHGDGSCAMPGSYTARYNTQTIFELFYYAQSGDGNLERNNLARYTGQVDDNIRDNGNHNTDMRWVSPGGTTLPTDPPTTGGLSDFGSFEVNLTTDVPNIVEDPATGVRYLYLDIQSTSGASENGFELWAGPPMSDYNADVNIRNIQMVDNLGSHYSDGVIVYAMGNLPMNSIFQQPVDIPLVYIGPEYAGQTVFVSLFDPDAGTGPPIAFFFDSLAYESDDDAVTLEFDGTDWGHLYGHAGDPNDENRCFHVDKVGDDGEPDNRCTNKWILPRYAITVPGDLDRCDYAYLDTLSGMAEFEYRRDNCTPFYGGRLFSRYASAFSDTYVWEIRLSGLPYLVR
jgi:hypothetical protein